MTFDDLTVSFQHLDRSSVLEDWAWLTGKRKLPILLTAAGDAFVQHIDDGTIHFLDVGANQIRRVATSPDTFSELLSDREFVAGYFNVQLVGDLRLNGSVLKPGQIYSYVKPPVLGGQYILENFHVADIEVHFSISGQIGHQVRNLPPGTKIRGINIS